MECQQKELGELRKKERIFDLHTHIDSSIDFSIGSSRCVDMAAQRLLGFLSDDRQILIKSLP